LDETGAIVAIKMFRPDTPNHFISQEVQFYEKYSPISHNTIVGRDPSLHICLYEKQKLESKLVGFEFEYVDCEEGDTAFQVKSSVF